jgi:hypothetical protein
VSAFVAVVVRSQCEGGERCAAPPAPPVAFDPTSAFALGSAGGTSCPSAMTTVLIAADCQNAADAAARPYGGSVQVFSGGLPTGCVWLTAGGSFFFNDASGGSGNEFAQPVCAGAPRVYGSNMHRGHMSV